MDWLLALLALFDVVSMYCVFTPRTARLDSAERERLLNSLETAIQGVENFSQRRGGDIERLAPPTPDSRPGQSYSSPAVTRFEPVDARRRARRHGSG